MKSKIPSTPQAGIFTLSMAIISGKQIRAVFLSDIFAAEYTNDYRVWYNRGDGTFRSTLFP